MATPTSAGVISYIGASGSHNVDSLLVSSKWGGGIGTSVSLTYSFGGADSVYASGYSEPTNGFASLSAVQKSAAAMALSGWAEVANVSFTEVTDSASVAGDIRFAKSSMPSTAWAYYPSASTQAGDVWFGHSSWYETDTKGTYGYMTFMHELGHTLGLTHPHTAWSLGGAADLSIDTTGFSVMSYRSYESAPLSGYTQNFYPTTPMINDIAAVQYLYGADLTRFPVLTAGGVSAVVRPVGSGLALPHTVPIEIWQCKT
jgi:serralysin